MPQDMMLPHEYFRYCHCADYFDADDALRKMLIAFRASCHFAKMLMLLLRHCFDA